MATENSSTSSLTSTSHTLTNAPFPTARESTLSLGKMSSLLEAIDRQNRHLFCRPSASLPAESLRTAKAALDAFASSVGDEQQAQFAELARKRKREGGEVPGVLKIRRVHVDGFDT